MKDNLPLSGRCLAVAGTERDDLRTLIDQVRGDLLHRQRNAGAHLRARIAAGLALGVVGHPDLLPQIKEFENRKVRVIVPPLQEVPAGSFPAAAIAPTRMPTTMNTHRATDHAVCLSHRALSRDQC